MNEFIKNKQMAQRNCPASQQEINAVDSQLGKENAIFLLGIFNGLYLPSLFYYDSRKRDLFLSLAQCLCPTMILIFGYDKLHLHFNFYYSKIFLNGFLKSILLVTIFCSGRLLHKLNL